MSERLFLYDDEASYNDDCYFWRLHDGACEFFVTRPWDNEQDLFSLAREFVETFRLGDSLQQAVVHYPTMTLRFEEWQWRYYRDEDETVAECVETTYIEVNTLTGATKKLPENEGKKMLKAQDFSPPKILVDGETYFSLIEESAKLKAQQDYITESAKKLGWYGPAPCDLGDLLVLVQQKQRLKCAQRARELLEAVDAPMVGKNTRKQIEDTLKSNFLRVL